MRSRYLYSLIIPFLLHIGSVYANVSYAQLSSSITQTPASGAGSPVKLEKTDAIKNFELSSGKDKLIVKEPGVYLVIASGQVGATHPGATGYVDCWFTKNGAPINNSAARTSVESSAFTAVLVTQFVIDLQPNDVLGLVFTASGPSLGFIYLKPDIGPGVTSMNFSIIKLE